MDNLKYKHPLTIPYPVFWLALVAILLYLPSVFYGITRLDDYVFLFWFRHYNSHWSDLLTSFRRGVFGLDDHYYRPVFLDTMLLNAHLWGGRVMGYHIVNILLHVLSVCLLYRLFVLLQVRQFHAFLLVLLFAVHPVLSQAVAWIPGRNDVLLAIFSFAFFIQTIGYSETGKLSKLLWSVLFLLLALFTKESGVFAVPAVLVILVGVLQKKWFEKRMLMQYVIWSLCCTIWLFMRSSAHLKTMHTSPLSMLNEWVHKLPLILQYLGKILLPVHLSVFPSIRDTSNYLGIIALVILGFRLLLVKDKNWRSAFCGGALFLIFVMPALLVPNYMSPQSFEHRLYLPVVGILFLLPQTILLKNRLSDVQQLVSFIFIAAILAVLNIDHQKNFANPEAFWSQAVKTSPSSAYARMMLAMQVGDKAKAHQLFRDAIRLNPKEQHLNYSIGITLQKEDSVLESEKYLLAEKAISNYYRCDFYLARVAVARQDYPAAIACYQRFVLSDPNCSPTDRATIRHNPNWQQPDSAKLLLSKLLQE